LSGAGEKRLIRSLVNNGTANLSGGDFGLQSGTPLGNFTNNGVFNASGDADIVLVNLGGNQPSFTNSAAAIFNHSGAGTTDVGVTFSNAGTVNVNAGTLSLTGTIAQLPGATLTGGTWNVFANSTLNVATGQNITTNAGNVKLSGDTSTFTKINTINNNQGSFTIENGRLFDTVSNLANSGTLTVGASSTLTVGSIGAQSSVRRATLPQP
jgi:hypothetical protein